MATVKVAYIGKKPFAIDNVAGSGKTWGGKGDIQEVTEAQARTLLKYPDQWALVDLADQAIVDTPAVIQAVDEHGDSVTVDPDSLKKPLERMTKAELVAHAQEKWGKALDATTGKKLMIDQIEEWKHELGE